MAKPCEICPYNKEWKRTGRCDHLCIMNPEPQTNTNQRKPTQKNETLDVR